MGPENGARVVVSFSETRGQRKSYSAQMFSEWHSGQNGDSNSTCCLRLMNVLRKTNNPTLKIRRGKSYLLDFSKSVIHAFPLKSCYAFVMSLLVPVAPLLRSLLATYVPSHVQSTMFVFKAGIGGQSENSTCSCKYLFHHWPFTCGPPVRISQLEHKCPLLMRKHICCIGLCYVGRVSGWK